MMQQAQESKYEPEPGDGHGKGASPALQGPQADSGGQPHYGNQQEAEAEKLAPESRCSARGPASIAAMRRPLKWPSRMRTMPTKANRAARTQFRIAMRATPVDRMVNPPPQMAHASRSGRRSQECGHSAATSGGDALARDRRTQGLADFFFQGRGGEGLLQQQGALRAETFLIKMFAGVSRHIDHFQFRAQGKQALGELRSAGFGHHHVGEEDIDVTRMSAAQRDGLGRRGGCQDLVSVGRED